VLHVQLRVGESCSYKLSSLHEESNRRGARVSMRYRQKPVIIEAVLVRDVVDALTASCSSWDALPRWVYKAYCDRAFGLSASDREKGLYIRTATNSSYGGLDDMLVLPSGGGLHFSPGEVIANEFEPMEDEESA